MYNYLYTMPNMASKSRLTQPSVDEYNKQYGLGNQIKRFSNAPGVSSTGFGVSINNISNNTSVGLTNEYLLDQKLRNSGMYTRLKNKTIYSQSALAHASLNKGIL